MSSKAPARPPKPGTADSDATPLAAAPAGDPPQEAKRRMIEVAAYFLAERRGFCPGCELDDWIAAEAEVEAQLRASSRVRAADR